MNVFISPFLLIVYDVYLSIYRDCLYLTSTVSQEICSLCMSIASGALFVIQYIYPCTTVTLYSCSIIASTGRYHFTDLTSHYLLYDYTRVDNLRLFQDTSIAAGASALLGAKILKIFSLFRVLRLGRLHFILKRWIQVRCLVYTCYDISHCSLHFYLKEMDSGLLFSSYLL